jgi:biotin synthase-related radical SAM superfamily protein
MTPYHLLEITGQWAAILTAALAFVAYFRYSIDLLQKRRKLEKYLRDDGRTHSIIHLVVRLGITEAQVIEASFRSRHIKRLVHVDKVTSLADQVLLEYSETKLSR